MTHCCKYAARGSTDRAEVWRRAEVWCRAEVKQAARGSADRAEVWRRAEWPGGRESKEQTLVAISDTIHTKL